MKKTRKILVSSLIMILSCCLLFAGTTFAWFSDSVTSGNNVIQAGNLDVELYYSVDGENWAPVDSNTVLFKENSIWEPGHTEAVLLKVVNAGSLALKYNLSLEVTSETGSVNVAGDAFKLSDFLEVGTSVAKTADASIVKDRKAAAELASKDLGFGTISASAMLIPTESTVDYVHVAICMPETVGNAANHAKDAVAPKITFGINLLATQLDDERDSFGPDYDAGLEVAENGVSVTLSDGSVVFYYNETSGFAGRVRLISLPENLGNEYVVPSVVNDLGGALLGVKLDKLTITKNVKNAKKSLEGSTIGEVVIENGATVIPNRLFYKANVKNFVIPESVIIIEENAFAQAKGVEELVIPASVTTVEEAAFQHMANLNKVTFEGNTAIQGYAFRGCAQLRTVVLKGEDTTFIPSTLNGRNSCWFCNGESNNPNTSDITFHVENDVVAERVIKAMGAEANNTKIYIDGVRIRAVSNKAQLQAALDAAEDSDVISLANNISGDVVVSQKKDVKITIDGNGYNYDGSILVDGKSAIYLTAGLTIKNVNFKTEKNELTFIKLGKDNLTRYVCNLTVSDCTFEGPSAVGVKAATGGNKNITISGCTVKAGAHTLIQMKGDDNVLVENCKVYSKNGISCDQATNVSIIGCEIDVLGYAVRFGASSGDDLVETYLIKDCTLKSACEDASEDAPIYLRGTASKATLTIENTTLVGTTEIINAANANIIRK